MHINLLQLYTSINLSKVKSGTKMNKERDTAGNLKPKNGMVDDYIVEYPNSTGRSYKIILLLNQLWPYCTEIAL